MIAFSRRRHATSSERIQRGTTDLRARSLEDPETGCRSPMCPGSTFTMLVEAATITSPFKSTGYIAKRLKYPRKYPHEKLLGTDMVRGPKRRSRRVIGLRVLRICGQSTAEIDRPRRPSLSGGNCSRQPDHRRRPPLPAPSTGEHAALSHRRTAASGSAE